MTFGAAELVSSGRNLTAPVPGARAAGVVRSRAGALLRALLVASASIVLGTISFAQVAGQEASAAEQAVYSDEEVKAAFLYNFGTYVEWPSDEPSEAFITIAVLGAPLIARELERFVRGRTIQGRPVRVRRLRTINDVSDDEVLFIGADENGRLAQLIEAIEGRPVLIVTDAPDGLSVGAMVNFQLVDRRVRFEIALRPAQDAGLMLSSRLLSAALRVETTRCRAECRDGTAEELPRQAKLMRTPGSRLHSPA